MQEVPCEGGKVSKMRTRLDDWLEWVGEVAVQIAWGEEPEVNVEEEDPAGLVTILEGLKVIERAVGILRKALENRLGEKLGKGGAIRYGDNVYRYQRTRRTKVTDPRALGEWLGDEWQTVVRVDGGNVRLTGLRTVAERRGMDPEVVENTFLDVEWGDERVTSIPLSRAPGYLQSIAEGKMYQRDGGSDAE